MFPLSYAVSKWVKIWLRFNSGTAYERPTDLNCIHTVTQNRPTPIPWRLLNIPVKTNLCEQLLAHTTWENFTPKFTDSPRLTVKCSQCTLNNYLKSHFQRKVVVVGVWSSAIGRSASEVTTLWHYTNMFIIIIIIIFKPTSTKPQAGKLG